LCIMFPTTNHAQLVYCSQLYVGGGPVSMICQA
jgi:hypothetical protein